MLFPRESMEYGVDSSNSEFCACSVVKKQIVKQRTMQANKKHIKKVAKPTLFHERWLKAYGLRVTARDAAMGSICSVECRFLLRIPNSDLIIGFKYRSNNVQ